MSNQNINPEAMIAFRRFLSISSVIAPILANGLVVYKHPEASIVPGAVLSLIFGVIFIHSLMKGKS